MVVDNQLVNMPIFALFKPDGKTPLPPAIWDKIKGVWGLVFEAMVELADPAFSFVLTNVLLDEDPGDHAWFANVAEVARRRGSRFLPVRLVCDLEENVRRVQSPGRAERMKQLDAETLRRMYREESVLRPDWPGALTLDVTALSPGEAAARVVEAAQGASESAP